MHNVELVDIGRLSEGLLSPERISAIASELRRIMRVPETYAAGEVEYAIRTAIAEAGEAAAKVCEPMRIKLTAPTEIILHHGELCAAEIRRRLT